MSTPTTPGRSSSAARAVAAATGHPALKLVLLTVAALPGWPTADEVADAAELSDGWTRDALAELVKRGEVTESRAARPYRYSLADQWGFASEREGEERHTGDIVPPPKIGGDIEGYAFGHHGAGMRRR